MKKFILKFAVFGILSVAVGLLLTQPKTIDDDEIAGVTSDAARGEAVFYQGGCASCHAAPGATGDAKMVLSGGRKFPSPFGTFIAPNISNHPVRGIGNWSDIDLINAMIYGTSPERRHYYPAFPYTSYARATVPDIIDLRAFLATLPASDTPSQPHDVGFPFNVRFLLGGWKLLFYSQGPVIDAAALSEAAQRGQKIVEGLGHCSECHTPRNMLGGLKKSRWMAGAPNPEGKGFVPNLTPHKDGPGWSQRDIAEYLKSGFTPEFDTAGSLMVDVIENTSKLTDQDRLDIAAYLLALPPRARQ